MTNLSQSHIAYRQLFALTPLCAFVGPKMANPGLRTEWTLEVSIRPHATGGGST